MSDVTITPSIAVPAVRVTTALALTAAVAVTTAQPQWRVPQWEWIALGVVLALAAAAAWSCTRTSTTGPTTAWSLITLAASAACAVAAAVGSTEAVFTPAAVTALLLLMAGEAERRSAAVSGVPTWIPVLALAAGISVFVGGLVVADPTVAMAAGSSVLVAAAPGALRLATPTALLIGRRQAARSRLTLGASTPALAATLDTVVLAPHGTVTEPEMRVVAVRPVEPDHERNLRWFSGALASARDDRLGRAVARLATGRVRLTHVERSEAGMSGTVDRHPVRLGDPAWVGASVEDDVWTVLAVEVDGRALGSLVVAEQVRENAPEQVAALRALGVEPVLVSEDTAARAQLVTEASGLPQARLVQDGDTVTSVIDALRGAGSTVGVIGPDAAGADLHVGEHAAGPSGIGAPDDAMARVVEGVRLARSVHASSRRSGRIAATLAVAGMALAAAGILAPLLAAAWAAGSAVVVVATASSGSS